MADLEDPRARFRIWVAGRLADEVWIDVTYPDAERRVDAARARHEAIADEADRQGALWLVEVYDPAVPEEQAYLRFGTDTAGMVDPGGVHPWFPR